MDAGERALFRSSNHVQRGFCAACGTPLTYEPDADQPALALGAFDDPAALPPTIQYGTEAVLPFMASIPDLPSERTNDSGSLEWLDDIVSYQHPDHDTAEWPPKRT